MRIAVLDIGGTSIKSGIWTGTAVEAVRETETNAKCGGCAIMKRAVEIIKTYEPFEAIGISSAGQVNSREGTICYANENIPEYTGMRIREMLEQEFHVPVAVENDVNAAAAGEGKFGAGADCENFLCITYGTGVGGAIVIDKKIYTGMSFSAGEFGGIITHPEARRPKEPFSGCYERYASTSALVDKAMKYDKSLCNGRAIFARLSEPNIVGIVDRWIGEIVCGLITLIHIFNPSCILLGGGVMEQPYVIEKIQQEVSAAIISSFSGVEIKAAALGNLAGLTGVAHLAQERLLSTKNPQNPD